MGSEMCIRDSGIYKTLLLETGKAYRVEFEIKSISAGAIAVGVGSGNVVGTFSTVGVHSCFGTATNQSMTFFSVGATTTATIDNVSVKEVLTWADPKYYLDFDGVDDHMVATSVAAASTRTLGLARHIDSGSTKGAVAYFVATSDAIGLYNFTSPTSYGFNTWNNDSWGVNLDKRGVSEVDVAYFVNGNPATSGVSLSINGSLASLSQVTGTSVSKTMSTGFRLGAGGVTTTQLLNGRIYGVVFNDRALSAGEQSSLESYLATKSGVTLP